jgi:bifunctional non-homologous end joining protein LigD
MDHEREDEERPDSAKTTTGGAFVVHLHDATRRHYDVRLEVGGLLWSFAVPRGPSLDPKEKVLAVKTEDHPLEYVDFEDVIPEGQYGAGPMIMWDRGAVRYLEGPAEEEITTGKLHIELRGMKLRGRWAFVKLAKSEKGNEWLLFKKQDETADAARSIIAELPRSVLSGLTVEELAEKDEIGRRLFERAVALGATTTDARPSTKKRLALALATPGDKTHGKQIYDAVLGGLRVLAQRDGDVVTLHLDPNESVEAYYPDVVRALRALPLPRVAMDGELVAFDAAGRPSAALLAKRAARIGGGEAPSHGAVTEIPVVFVAEDLLEVGAADLREVPIEARRSLLTSLLPSVGILRAATPLEGREADILSTCAALGIASVIAKPKGSTYGARGAGGERESGWTLLPTGITAEAPPSIRHARAGSHSAPPKVTISNRDKVFWPEEGYTKGDLVDYYDAIAEVVLPHLKDRPTILVRYPDGIHGKSFFQWNVPVGMPPWVQTMTMNDPDGEAVEAGKAVKRGFLVNDRATLVYIANLGCIPLHILASRAPDFARADFLTLDFDIKQSTLAHAVTLAKTLAELLAEIGLEGFPKTSGQTGLHVLVPLGPGQSFDTSRALADLLGRILVDRHPKIATMERVVAKRGPKVYVDTGQTGTSRAIVAPYSVRAVAGATVSTPLAWDEVKPSLDPSKFTIRTVPSRVKELGDLFEKLLQARPDVPAAVTALAGLFRSPA